MIYKILQRTKKTTPKFMLKLQAKGSKASEAKWYFVNDNVLEYAQKVQNDAVIDAKTEVKGSGRQTERFISYLKVVKPGTGSAQPEQSSSNGTSAGGYSKSNSYSGGYSGKKSTSTNESIENQVALKAAVEIAANVEGITAKNAKSYVTGLYEHFKGLLRGVSPTGGSEVEVLDATPEPEPVSVGGDDFGADTASEDDF